MMLTPQVWISRPGRPDVPPRAADLKPSTNRDYRGRHAKPHGGLWTSPLRSDGSCGWAEWCEDSEMAWVGRAWLLHPAEARVFEIDSYEDLYRLWETHGGIGPPAHFADEPWIDWESVGQEFDAIYLTDEGEARTRLSLPLTLYGWDCEAVLWFRWCFSRVEPYEFPVLREVVVP